MYRLHRLGSLHDPDALWLDYEWGPTFDNTEWRPCVDHFMTEVGLLGHDVVAVVPRPAFRQGEDFVEIEYLLDGSPVRFSSDHLLSLIEIHGDGRRVLREIWNQVGAKVGWIEG
jgi:hypothetical protein